MAKKRQKNYDIMQTADIKNESRYEAVWQGLTITDDFIFGKIMRDPDLCMELLRRIFPQYDIERIEYIKVQESIRLDKEAKGIQLDVFVKDSRQVAFCVEMQTRNVDNLPKRSRYYQSLVDLELLDRGRAYDELARSYVIFICPVDLFGCGHYLYEFRNYCTQDRQIELGDEAAKVFLNASGTRGDIHPPLKEFLDYVAGKETEEPSEFIVRLKAALDRAKQNREWRREHMILYFREQDIRADALEEGRQEGRQEGIFAMIVDGLEEGLPLDQIVLKLQKRFSLTEEEARDQMECYCREHRLKNE